ncbi:MAG: hypothetical protein HQL98_13240 [Magnetococcales bacterium]|nr:hypothetical protein [Magnetococcales bacterium]
MPHLTCPQCGTPLSPDQTASLRVGDTLPCLECGALVNPEERRKHDAGSQSPALALFLDHATENDPERYLGFEAARIRRFESHLQAHKLTLRTMRPGDVQAFLKRIHDNEGPESAHGYALTLREFFKTLTLKGELNVNPLSEERQATAPPMDTRGFSEELVTFVTQQEGIGFTENLHFDVRRIQVWEAFLARRNKNARTAEEKELVEFMAMAHRRFTPKQAYGLALTLQEFYQVMLQSGLMTQVPSCPDFVHCREALEEILANGERSENAERNENGKKTPARPRPIPFRSTAPRRRRAPVLIIAGVLCAVTGLLIWQLLPRAPGQDTVMGNIRQKAKNLKNSLTGTQHPTPTPGFTPPAGTPTANATPPTRPVVTTTPPVSTPPALPPGSAAPTATAPTATTAANPARPDANPPASTSMAPLVPGPAAPAGAAANPARPLAPGIPPVAGVIPGPSSVTNPPAALTNAPTLGGTPPARPLSAAPGIAPIPPMAEVPPFPAAGSPGFTPRLPTTPAEVPNFQPNLAAKPPEPPIKRPARAETVPEKPKEIAPPVRLIGCVEGNCTNGFGTFVHDDGARYIGNWSQGKKHGAGEFRFPSGGGYRGTWKNGHVTKIE